MNKNIEMLLDAGVFLTVRPNDLHINLETILKSGTVNMVKKGMPLSLAATLLPVPEEIDHYDYNAYDLSYGETIISIADDRITAIEMPVEDGYIDAGRNAYIDYWHFEDTEEITLLGVQAVLSSEYIPFSIEYDPLDDEVVYLTITQNGVILSFWADETEDFEDVFSYKLSYISL